MRPVLSRTVEVLLFSITVGALGTGCFVLTGKRRNKPIAPSDSVMVNKNSDELRYSRLFKYSDFNLEVGVKDGPARWEAVFLFYVIPLPYGFDSSSRAPVSVELHLAPKSGDI